jgi:hypothetical protein
MTLLQTVARSYCECVAPWEMHKKRGEVNRKHVREGENLMRQEASE